jgi:hypothetical protein
MRPLTLEKRDLRTLQDLGLASIQVVHDLKNQLNGLKLYATFLRKRLETSERPADELEAIAKLISGLERTASELTVLVRYGRPLELRTRPSVPLDKVLSSLLSNDDIKDQVQLEVELASYNGEFDYNALTEALKTITVGALSMRRNGDRLGIHLTRDKQSSLPHVLIEWRDIKTSENDVFRTLAGSDGLRMALAAKIIEGHQGKAEQQDGLLRVSLPIE